MYNAGTERTDSMAIAPDQPAYNSEISTFIQWVEKNSAKGTIGSDPVPTHPFMPLPRLEKHLKEKNRTRWLLKALFPESTLPVDPEDVWRYSIRGFSILLLIGKGGFIQHFVQHDQLWDSKLPLSSRPPHFPTSPGHGDFFDAFIKMQWRFYPHTFHANGNTKLDNECILPVILKEPLGSGGSALTYKITLYPDYDQLSNPRDVRQDVGYEYANIYVLKTYRFKDAKDNYETEVRAFKALMSCKAVGTTIIGFFGSYEQDETYNVLLEYADRGTLENYLQTTPPPTTGPDIYKFWSALLNVIKALVSIHNVQGDDSDPPVLRGWHQDVTPSNILVTSGKSGSRYDCEFKLADLGLSHFRKVRASHGSATDRDTSGTREYGAPDCYRFDNFMEETSFRVDQTVDLWSLGCIVSEVAVWVAHDKDQLAAYREARLQETQKIPNFKDGRAFHDGERVLESVSTFHSYVLQNIRQSDYVTKPVVERLISEMLVEVAGRSPAKQLWYKAGRLLDEARKKLDPPGGESRQLGGRERRAPPVRPPDLRTPPVDRFWSVEPHRGGSLNRGLQYRSQTCDPTCRAVTPSPQLTTEPESVSPGPIAHASPATPQTSPLAPTSAQSPPRHAFAHGIAREPNWPSYQYQNGRLDLDHSPTPQPASPRDRSFTLPTMRNPDHAGGRNIPEPSPILNHADLDEGESNRTQAEDLSPPPVNHGPSRSDNDQNTTAMTSNLTTPDRNHARKKVPDTKLHTAAQWLLNKKNSRGHYPPLEHIEHLEALKDRDHVFLVDDTLSMLPYKEQVVMAVHVLAYLLKPTDKDGLDLCFTNDQAKYNSKRSKDLLQRLAEKRYSGTSDMESSLGKILHNYQQDLEEAAATRRWSWTPKPKRKKARNVYVLTDGLWQPQSNPAGPIASLVATLQQLNYPRYQVGIQFIRFGNDPAGIEMLEYLDSGLGLPMDIVDAEPFDGNLWKMLLGAVNKWFDGDQNHGADRTSQVN